MPHTIDENPNTHDKEPEPSGKDLPIEQISQTQHTAVVDGREIKYTATAGTIILTAEEEGEDKKAEGEKSKVSIFFIAYTRDDIDNPNQRPLTFSFNGGPGSSSVWLHLGLLGPRRVLMDNEGHPLPPPYRLVNNEQSLLDVTDLVFIDPATTGYSRVVPGEKANQFHNFEKDIESVGEFIRLFTTRFKRWASPKFLIGESYGTTRAAGLSGFLQDRHGMYLNGVMLISSILNFQTARFVPGNDLPCMLFLPTYTATAWYHQRLPDDLQQRDLQGVLHEAEEFVEGEYALALIKGDALPAKDRHEIVAKLTRYTGLSPAYIEQTNLRINIHRFVKELLRGQRRSVGRLDSRFTGIDRDAAGENVDFDPSLAAIMGPYTATLNDYVRTALQFESNLPYEILTSRVHPWGYDTHQNQFVNVAETLREAMTKNPHLKVLVANGYYDLATPYFATRYTFNHLGLDPSLHDNITMTYYEAGHMMYVHLPSLARLKQDLAGFIQGAT